MKFIENMVNMKINTITGDELLKYAKKFDIVVTKQQADKVAAYLRGKNINIFDNRQRTMVIKEIAKITSPETAKKLNQLFILLTK